MKYNFAFLLNFMLYSAQFFTFRNVTVPHVPGMLGSPHTHEKKYFEKSSRYHKRYLCITTMEFHSCLPILQLTELCLLGIRIMFIGFMFTA